jgi:hypothetical protein
MHHLSRFSWLFGVLLMGCGGEAPPAQAPDGPAPGATTDPAPAATGADPAAPEASAAPAAPAGKTLEEHHKDFVAMCNKAANIADYCECSWGVFKQSFSIDEMNQNGGAPPDKLAEFQGKVRNACADKMPEEMIEAGFKKGCTQGREGFDDYCSCSWPELRKKFSAAELARDETTHSDKFRDTIKQVAKSCGKKLPEAVMQKAFMLGCTKHGPDTEKFCTCAWKQMKKSMSMGDLAMGQESPAFESAQKSVQKGCKALKPKE